jgi:hypothetical protein
MRTPKVCLGAVGLLLAASALSLLLGEGLLRIFGQSYYWALAKRPDPVLGWRPPPSIAAWQRFEGAALVRTNALGFRDRDHAPEKPPRTLRVAVLGDSFTEAVQVPLEQTWWRVMASRLGPADCPTGARVEVLSFAVSGYSTAQSLLAWRAHARGFSPDAVVLALFIGNDLTENLRALDAEPLRPYLRPAPSPAGPGSGAGAQPDAVAAGGGLILDDGFRATPAYRRATSAAGRARQWLLLHSRIAQLVVQARDAWRLRGPVTATGGPDAGRSDVEPGEPGVDNGVYRPPDTDVWRRAWRATEVMLAAFATETRAAGAEPVLMLIGTGAQVHPHERAALRFAAAIGVPDLGYPVRRLLAVARHNDLPVLNLPALMAAQAERDGVLLHGFPGGRPGFGHWNQAGHLSAGAEAARLVCAVLRDAASSAEPPPGPSRVVPAGALRR